MSKHRATCISHHNKLVLYITPKDETLPYNNNYRNPKDFYGDLLHRRWASKRIYNHFSQRLGISFDTKYHAYGLNNVLKKDQDIGIIPVQPVKDNNVPTDESIVSTDPILDKVPSHLIPLIPDYPFYAGGLLNQPSPGKIKGKKLQPLVVGSEAWLAHMEEIYVRHERDRIYKEKLLAYSIKWDTDPDRAEYREDGVWVLMAYTDALHAYELKKLEIASRPPCLPVTKNTNKKKQKKKNKQADNASTSTATPAIMTDKEFLEQLHSEVLNYEHGVYDYFR
ncbi:unnamed protein product [Rhizophagus irregularis]|nr:unnamed protein product [Rhizophagus irregularis]